MFNIWFVHAADLNTVEGHVASVGGEARDHFTARGTEHRLTGVNITMETNKRRAVLY